MKTHKYAFEHERQKKKDSCCCLLLQPRAAAVSCSASRWASVRSPTHTKTVGPLRPQPSALGFSAMREAVWHMVRPEKEPTMRTSPLSSSSEETMFGLMLQNLSCGRRQGRRLTLTQQNERGLENRCSVFDRPNRTRESKETGSFKSVVPGGTRWNQVASSRPDQIATPGVGRTRFVRRDQAQS